MGLERFIKPKKDDWEDFPATPIGEIPEDLKIDTDQETAPEMGQRILDEIQREEEELNEHDAAWHQKMRELGIQKNKPTIH